jgi:hypothetical protein
VFAVIYRWELEPGAEELFVDGWERVTRAIRRSCGSYGSRLHRADDGTWVGYARWPDAATRDRCRHDEEVGRQMMRQAIARSFDEITMEIRCDLLAEPA